MPVQTMGKAASAVTATLRGNSMRNAPDKAHSGVSMARTQSHNLPLHVIALFTIIIPCLVAVINVGMVALDLELVTFKFETMERLMIQSGSAWTGGLAMAGICALYALVSASLVLFVDPKSAGSGIPEAKSYLNGNEVPGFWTNKGLFVRAAGVIFTVAAGFPVGREGPMVGIGGCVGVAVVTFLATPYMSKWVKMDSEDGALSSALITDENRFAYALRLGCVLGSSAGIATAFNAPIGGILYMFEETTVTNWAPETTFKAFIGSVAAVLISQAMMKLLGSAAHTLLIFDPDADPQAQKNGFIDWVFVAIAAAFIGALSALFAKCLARVWAWRKQVGIKLTKRGRNFSIAVRLLEAMSYAALCAVVFTMIPSLVPCDESTHSSGSSSGASAQIADAVGSSGRRLAGLTFRRYTCDSGEHNKIATLFLTGAEGAVKHLFDQSDLSFISPSHLLISLVVYFIMACGMPGLQVPMGCFVPSMLMGALSGRLFGEIFGMFGSAVGLQLANPGVYSMAGAAAFLGGFTHMTLAITALLVEASKDLSLIPIMMLSISVSHIVSTSISHHGYDEVLIHKKGVPYLEAELPHDLDDGRLAVDMMDEYPDEAILSEKPSLDDVQAALALYDIHVFPVVDDDGVCVGTVLRMRLEAAVQAHQTSPEVSKPTDGKAAVIATLARRPSNIDVNGVTVPVHRIMDRCPHSILEDMPVSRFYAQFSLGSCDHATVISRHGEFRGVVTRRNLISSAGHAHAAHLEVRRSVTDTPAHEVVTSDVPLEGEEPAVEGGAPAVLLGNTRTKPAIAEKPTAATVDNV